MRYKKIVFEQYVAVSWKQYKMHTGSIADRRWYVICWTVSLSVTLVIFVHICKYYTN